MKTKKLLPLILFTANFFLLPNFSFAAIQVNSPNQDFSDNAIGSGLTLGVRFNLANDIFTDSEEIEFNQKTVIESTRKSSSKKSDNIFTEIGIFGNQFFSGEIKQNFGGKINLGYENHGFRIYGSGGYLASTLDYQEQGQSKQSLLESSPFFGGGIGYDITKSISLRLDGMFYNFDFKSKTPNSENIDVDVATATIGLGFYF
ncbi:MAG: opacity protein-like surface antigen [Rickettsiales bacterium]|jgi:opacity protein-like surface antigen